MKNLILAFCLTLAALTAPAATKSPAADPAAGLSGKVVETTNTAGYTYILVDTGKQKKWAAAPAFKVKVGDSVVVSDPMPMEGYHSKTLNRDFDVVYFSGGVAVNGAAGRPVDAQPMLPKDHPPVNGAAAMPTLPKDHPPIAGAAAPTFNLTGIAKASGGKTVAEIVAARDTLAGQVAKVHARVVKFNANILGKNWLHIRDGSGAEGSNDLLVTTDATVKPGDLVLVSGKVTTNKDLGMGYKYAVLLEDCKVTAE